MSGVVYGSATPLTDDYLYRRKGFSYFPFSPSFLKHINEFEPKCDKKVLYRQFYAMRDYKKSLDERTRIENIIT